METIAPAQNPTLSEWLVTDHRGAFAMGTPEGFRARKYHGFYQTIAGRSETSYLTDLELICNGHSLWPHSYSGPEGRVIQPNPDAQGVGPSYRLTEKGPEWKWTLPEGRLALAIEARSPGGIRIGFRWQSSARKAAQLLIRPFWGMRPLHAVGGSEWRAETLSDERLLRISSPESNEAYCRFEGPLRWVLENPLWYHRFRYEEELRRGYPFEENLQAGGFWEGKLKAGESCALLVSEDARDLEAGVDLGEESAQAAALVPLPQRRVPALDFLLSRPAGIVAGYPWFGEWGRDTFIALPGLVGAWLRSGAGEPQVWAWARQLLDHWGQWIEREGMLPNLIERGGQCQWQSADATLWWCHSLAALWQLSLTEPYPFQDLRWKYRDALAGAIEAIRGGKHRFLRLDSEGLLEVTEEHVTWMDARVNGAAVTPRTGRLPEINALWFQAQALHALWQEASGSEPGAEFERLEALGERVLTIQEPGRPNPVFLHSIPLAPSFVLKDMARLAADVEQLGARLATPVGLRTLDPADPRYRSRCVGTQTERDLAYHQGLVWGWLGGHFEMARMRLAFARTQPSAPEITAPRMFPPTLLSEMPIEGHVPEIFDAEQPFTPRGAPAQAWSLACLEEAQTRKASRADAKLTQVLAQRWLGRRGRIRSASQSEASGSGLTQGTKRKAARTARAGRGKNVEPEI